MDLNIKELVEIIKSYHDKISSDPKIQREIEEYVESPAEYYLKKWRSFKPGDLDKLIGM